MLEMPVEEDRMTDEPDPSRPTQATPPEEVTTEELDESALDSIAGGRTRGPDGMGAPIPPTLEQCVEQNAAYDSVSNNLLPRY